MVYCVISYTCIYYTTKASSRRTRASKKPKEKSSSGFSLFTKSTGSDSRASIHLITKIAKDHRFKTTIENVRKRSKAVLHHRLRFVKISIGTLAIYGVFSVLPIFCAVILNEIQGRLYPCHISRRILCILWEINFLFSVLIYLFGNKKARKRMSRMFRKWFENTEWATRTFLQSRLSNDISGLL